jgi:RimJ/RimL family protein N-acetyltransferase
MAMRIPVLQTERLTIREFEMGDLEIYHRIANEGFGEQTAENTGLDDRRSWLEWTVRSYRELDMLNQPPYGDRAVVHQEEGRLIGSVGLVPAIGPFGQLPYFIERDGYEDRHSRAEFGLYWVIDPAFQRQGYATEAAQALIDHLFTELNLSRVIATTEYTNQASMGVMKRLGMKIQKNPYPDPFWFQIVGILEHT